MKKSPAALLLLEAVAALRRLARQKKISTPTSSPSLLSLNLPPPRPTTERRHRRAPRRDGDQGPRGSRRRPPRCCCCCSCCSSRCRGLCRLSPPLPPRPRALVIVETPPSLHLPRPPLRHRHLLLGARDLPVPGRGRPPHGHDRQLPLLQPRGLPARIGVQRLGRAGQGSLQRDHERQRHRAAPHPREGGRRGQDHRDRGHGRRDEPRGDAELARHHRALGHRQVRRGGQGGQRRRVAHRPVWCWFLLRVPRRRPRHGHVAVAGSDGRQDGWQWESSAGAHSYSIKEVGGADAAEAERAAAERGLHARDLAPQGGRARARRAEQALCPAEAVQRVHLLPDRALDLQDGLRGRRGRRGHEEGPGGRRRRGAGRGPAQGEGRARRARDDLEAARSSSTGRRQNDSAPLWTRSPKEVEKTEYNAFFKTTFKEFLDPLAVSHFSVEGTIEFTALLYVPSMAPFEQQDWLKPSRNVKLFVKRVFISDEFDGDLLPRWASFVRGVVDSADLPLNVSPRDPAGVARRADDQEAAGEAHDRDAQGKKECGGVMCFLIPC